MNKVEKGKRIERELEKILKEAGYITYKSVNVMYQKKDIFGNFDIIALLNKEHKKELVSYVAVNYPLLFIQVKSSISGVSKAINDLRKLLKKTKIKSIREALVAVYYRQSRLKRWKVILVDKSKNRKNKVFYIYDDKIKELMGVDGNEN